MEGIEKKKNSMPSMISVVIFISSEEAYCK